MEEPTRCELEMDMSQINQNESPAGSWLCCLPCYWLKRNSGFHKMSLSVVTLLVTVLLVASPVLFLISSIPGDKVRDCAYQAKECVGSVSEKVCLEEECMTAGNRILASMSPDGKPCQDFYRFACGAWEKRAQGPETEEDRFVNFVTLQEQVDRTIQQLLTVGANSDPFEKLGDFYKSCIRAGNRRTSFLPMLSLLEDLGGYVMPSSDPPEDLTDLVFQLLRLNGAILFDIYLDSDFDNSSELAPFIDLPLRTVITSASKYYKGYYDFQEAFSEESSIVQNDEGNNSSTFYEEMKNKNNAYNFIKASIEEKRLLVMEKIIRDFMPQNLSARLRINETRKTLHFANIITKLYPGAKEIIKSSDRKSHVKMRLEELERKFPFIRWQNLLEKLFDTKLAQDDSVFVLAPDYLDNLQRILQRFDSRVVHNGLLLIFATDTLYELVNTSSSRDWPAFCNKITVRVFGKAVSILYVRQYGEKTIQKLRSRVTRIFENLIKTFEKRIEETSWLDEATRSEVLHKLAALRVQFLTWPHYYNATYATSLMENVRVDPDDFFGNVIRRYRQLRNVPVSFKREQSEEKRWAYPFVVNAFYVLSMNTIIIPLALLTQPYFREEVPLYLPYSTIGLILAHEILHGFDLKGIGYDADGKSGALLSPESRAKLEARLDCFVRQFSSAFWKKVDFLGTSVDVQFDWNITKNENMADISGLQIAYQSWKSITNSGREATLPGVRLSAQQLFFLNAAQTYCAMLSPADYIFLVEVDFHTPQPERVNGIMMNSPGFAEAFKCPLGSPMNPRKKCSTWSQVLMRAVLLSCPVRENGCEENDILSQTMVAEQEQLLQANGKTFENLKETRTNEFPKAVKDCKRKIVITMKVKNNGKVPCEDKYIVVDHVYDPVTGSRGRLLSPVVLKLRQEQMVQLFGLQFERVVNNEPYEEQISQGKFCSVSPDNPTCGVSMYDGKPIPFSEGFCCSCNNHINAKRQLSSKSHGDSFVYRDSNLISQGHNHFNHEVEPILINPKLVQLRQKKQYDYSKTEQQYLKRLNSEKIPNFLLEKDRKIMCDKGDFMNELCELRKEKLAIEGKKDSDAGVKQELPEKGKPQAAGTLTNVPNTKNRFTVRDSMEVFNAEPKIIPGTEFKGSRGKRENRYKMEDNSLEENLERFLRTKKLYRNRRKRLLKISHRRNQSKKIRCNSDECLLPEFPDKDYVKPPPPAYFFSHDKVVLNPMESTKSNISNKSPMESAYNGLKYALEQNRFDTQWNKNSRKPIQRFKGSPLKNHASFDLKNNFQRVNMKKEYLPPDKNIYGKGPTYQMEEAQNEKGERQGKYPESYFGVENNENSKIRNYYLSKNKEYMNNKKQSGMYDVKKKQKGEMKDYNEDTKDMNESNEINEYRKELNRREKIRNFKADNQNFEDKTTQEKFEPNNQKFGRTPQGNYPSYFSPKDGGENFDFNVEITHQDFPMAVKPRFSYKNTEYILNRPEIKSSLRKAKLNQMKNNRPPFYFYYNQNFPQDVRIENNPLEFQNPNHNLKDPSWMSPDYDKKEASLDYHKEQPKYFAPPLQYLGRNTRPRPFQSKYGHYKVKDEVEYSHDEDSMEEPTKKKVRERRSINEFEPAKGYLASDANSNVAPHEFDICPVETVKKPSEVKPIDINAEILSGLPKLKEKIAKLGDSNNKIHRSLKTDLDRLIQSYLSAPDYVLKEIEAAKEGVKREERNLNEMRNSTCGKSVDGEYTQETAHCMRFGDLWYSVYNIKKPVISQTVGLQLFDKRTLAEGKSKWRDLTKGKMVRIGTFLSSAEDELPSLSLTFTGEESDSLHSPIDTENYVLLVPSHLSDPSKTNLYPQLEGGPNEYLLVSKKDVSSGEDCNKIGTSFEAFARQRKRCVHYRGSCLKRQAADLWREDMEARIRGKRGKYFVENFGTVPNSPIKTFTNLTGEYLAMEYYGDYSSTIEVELKADHNLIIRKERANAQIPTVYVDGTHPKKTRIFMSVLNTGLTSSSFRPRLGECSPDFDPSWCPLEGSPVTIPPQKRHDFKLDLSGALPASKLHATVQVLNQDNQPVAKRKIRIKRGERCMCAFNCKCNCMGDLENGKTCRRLDENEYRAAGYLGPPPFRSRSLIAKSFFGSFRLAFLSASYIMLMFGLLKGILGVYFRPLGIVGVRIITGPRKLCHYYEPDLLCCTVLHDELGFPIHPTTCKPVQIVPLYCEVLLNVFFFFLYLIRGFWLILKSSICVKIVFGDCDSSGQDKDSDSKCCRPLLSQQNICMNYNVRTVTSKKCPADEFLPYLRYRGDNDPLEEDDTEFILQEMQKHKKK